MNWNVPPRISAPSTASPITSAAIGTASPRIPSAATLANARSGDVSIAWASSPNSTAPAHAASTAAHRFGGTHDRSV